MDKTNYYYLYNQTTREKMKRNKGKNDLFNPRYKYIYDYTKKKNNSKSPFLQTYHDNKKNEKNERKTGTKTIGKKNNKYFYSSLNMDDIPLINNKNNKNNKNIITNREASTATNKKSNYQRCNSMAYIKKRPNDLTKSRYCDNTINNTLLRNSFKMKGRCLSCTNIIKKFNISYNDQDENFINNTTKNSFLPINYHYQYKLNNEMKEDHVNSFYIKNEHNKFLTKNIICNKILNMMKKIILSSKISFFKKLKTLREIYIYEVSFEEFKFLEELKHLGVTNKKQLNILLEDIYMSVKESEENKNKK